ncbi:MAG: hypothetical protein SGJ27_26960 [Candidatus Melainabacteria bacterium]|nr:hypothetical protein [Candidatus Melainabacteria bacterium]
MEVEDIGCVKFARFPDRWLALPQKPDPLTDHWTRVFARADNFKIEISFYYRGMPIDDDTAKRFNDLVTSRTVGAVPEKLSPIEIKDLQIAMGYNHAGDNQYTNSNMPGAANGPIFDLAEVSAKRVAGRTVLYARGDFNSGTHYAGIFYPSDSTGRVIEEFMLQAPDKVLLKQHLPAFESIIETFVWR